MCRQIRMSRGSSEAQERLLQGGKKRKGASANDAAGPKRARIDQSSHVEDGKSARCRLRGTALAEILRMPKSVVQMIAAYDDDQWYCGECDRPIEGHFGTLAGPYFCNYCTTCEFCNTYPGDYNWLDAEGNMYAACSCGYIRLFEGRYGSEFYNDPIVC